MKAVKKLGFVMNRLAFIGPLLKAGQKVKHEGFPLWVSVLEGDTKAQNRMKKYCIQDTKLLVTLYKRSEEHTSELQSLMRISYAVLCLNKKNKINKRNNI